MMLCSIQAFAYTVGFRGPWWANPESYKFVVWHWSTDQDGSWSDWMTAAEGHDGWFVTSIPNEHPNYIIAIFYIDKETPAWDGSQSDQTADLTNDGFTYYWTDLGRLEGFEGKLTDGRLLAGGLLYNLDDEHHTAQVAAEQSAVAPVSANIPSSVTYNDVAYTVTSVAEWAFYGSGGTVTSVSIPNTVTEIGRAAFWGLGNVVAPLIIPESLTAIPNEGFASSAWTSVSIPSTVETIGWSAFNNCGNLTSVVIPEGVKSLGIAAFQSCGQLAEISLPESLEEIGNDVFSYTAISSITIPDGVKELSASALAHCESLTEVILNGVDTIGGGAFYESANIERLVILTPTMAKHYTEDITDAYNMPNLASTCQILVPAAVKAAYEADDYWNDFTIKGIYTVTFKDWDGSTIVTRTVEQGQAAEAPADPTREGYDFTGWDVAFNNITSDLVVTATYEIKHFTVRFLDYNSSVLKSQTVDWDNDASAPANPSREGHTFAGWDPADFTHIKANLDVTATYTINTYSVTFVDWNDEVLRVAQTVDWNEAAIPPSDPSRTGYDFTGWDKPFEHVTADMTVKATYEIKHFNVTFYDYDGTTVLKETQVIDWNEAAEAPADPEREGYTFAGWSPADFSHVTANMNITATYTINTYSVTFVDYNDEVLKAAQTVEWNAAAVPPANPTRTGYDFTGWDKTFDHVTADLTVKATYEIKHFTVVFKDYDGTILKAAQTVDYGHDAEAPANPHRAYYTFNGWDTDYTNVTSDLVVTATYLPGENADITVTFIDPEDNTKELGHTDVVIRFPAAPEIENFTFLYWRPVAEQIDGEIKIEAVYTPNDPTSAPKVYTNPANPAQKLIRDGNVYILSEDRMYNLQGQVVQ